MTIVAAMGSQPRRDENPAPASLILEHTAQLIREFQLDWQREIPDQIHGVDFDADGIPQWHPDFVAYIERTCKKPGCHDLNCRHGMRTLHPDSRVRVSRAFRRLRREAPREFDALYLVTRYSLTLDEVAARLSSRSISLGHADRYTHDGILVLVVSAAHKIEQWS